MTARARLRPYLLFYQGGRLRIVVDPCIGAASLREELLYAVIGDVVGLVDVDAQGRIEGLAGHEEAADHALDHGEDDLAYNMGSPSARSDPVLQKRITPWPF